MFPSFDQNLREAFRTRDGAFSREPAEGRPAPLPELLNADYTFVNERLARHYGIPNVYGSHFRRVALRDDNRKGLLGHGSILTLTSYSGENGPDDSR